MLTVINLYESVRRTLDDPQIRKQGYTIDHTRTLIQTVVPVENSELPIEPDIYDWLSHRLYTFKERGYKATAGRTLTELKKARASYEKSLQGWIRDEQEKTFSVGLRWQGVLEISHSSNA